MQLQHGPIAVPTARQKQPALLQVLEPPRNTGWKIEIGKACHNAKKTLKIGVTSHDLVGKTLVTATAHRVYP